ncbi:MAG: hypothetical protein NZT92_01965 [Abditibacteriales bacterium]|nr:hypothetical protein [Abditibacteriales bacterium]MDW8364650.1 hypothetical protein [Abditibacteriales bacterium]
MLNQIPWSPPGTGFTHRPQQHRLTVEVQFRKHYPPPSTSIASDSVLVSVITTILWDVTPEYLLWNPDVGQPLQITWTLEHAAPISSPPLRKRVHIFDLSGQRVRSLYYNPQVDPGNEFTDTAPGSKVEVWDGKGDPDPVTGEQQVMPRGFYSFEIFTEHLFDSESHKNTEQHLTLDDVRLRLTGSTGAQTNLEVSCLLSKPGAAPPRQPSKMRALLFNWDLIKLDEKSISNPPLSPTRAVVTTLVASLSDPRPYFVAVIAEDGRRDEDRIHRYRPAIMRGYRDDWLSLRDVCRRHTKGDTFALTLLN